MDKQKLKTSVAIVLGILLFVAVYSALWIGILKLLGTVVYFILYGILLICGLVWYVYNKVL